MRAGVLLPLTLPGSDGTIEGIMTYVITNTLLLT
jgi:hypothetical protein